MAQSCNVKLCWKMPVIRVFLNPVRRILIVSAALVFFLLIWVLRNKSSPGKTTDSGNVATSAELRSVKSTESPSDNRVPKISLKRPVSDEMPDEQLESTGNPFEFVVRNPDGSLKTWVRTSEAGDVLSTIRYGEDGEDRTNHTYDNSSRLLRTETFHNGLKISEEIFR